MAAPQSSLNKINIFLRSLIFYILFWLITVIHALLSLCTYPFSPIVRYKFITLHPRMITCLAKIICGITYKIEGAENLPKENAIIFSNHQSTWETLAFTKIFPPQTWVIKQELLKVPFFGWAFKLMRPIAINRADKASAMEQVLEQGKTRLAEGLWVIIFPEGTRVATTERRRFTRGGATLAAASGYPVVPVAHNAGNFWPRRSFLKIPGTIRVVIGPIIISKDKTAEQINAIAQQWVHTTLDNIVEQ